MELETLKKSWERLDKRIKSAATLNQKLIESIISSRVSTTVGSIKRLYALFYVILAIEIIFLVALFIGNPFDFKYTLQFGPYVLLLAGVVIAFFNLLHIHKAINKLSPGSRIDHYLTNIVSIYDRNKRFEKWFGVIFLSVGLLVVPVSVLPQKIERMGLIGALSEFAIMIAVTLIIYLLAFKLGAFKNRYRLKLEKDLQEWKTLKALSEDIHE